MSAYLILVILVMLVMQGQPEVRIELGRQWTIASSASVCQREADRLAEQLRAANAPTVARLGARVVGSCVLQGELT